MTMSRELHERARARVDAWEEGGEAAETFDAFACELARYQRDHAPGFARLCHARGITTFVTADDIPPVPTDAFKLTDVGTVSAAEASLTFRTSGTTLGARGRHHVRDVRTYDRAAVAFGRHWLARDLAPASPVVVLGQWAADSSLAHMCRSFIEAFGDGEERSWLLDGDVFDVDAFDERVAFALTHARPMLVLATSFALVHFLDALGDTPFRLPQGSRVMQTGGYKGKSREVPAAQLRSDVARAFAIDPRAVVAEYGMTELSSQFYERTLFDPAASHGIYAEPPWARVVPVDDTTLEPVPDGEIGIAKIIDLMNVDSAVAILTQDRVRRTKDGFELLGRAPGAPPRGCSIAIDEILGN
jgi:hypothetical protein